VTLTCVVGRFLKVFNHVKVRKIEKEGTNDPFAERRLVYVKVKQSRYRPGEAQRVPGS